MWARFKHKLKLNSARSPKSHRVFNPGKKERAESGRKLWVILLICFPGGFVVSPRWICWAGPGHSHAEAHTFCPYILSISQIPFPVLRNVTDFPLFWLRTLLNPLRFSTFVNRIVLPWSEQPPHAAVPARCWSCRDARAQRDPRVTCWILVSPTLQKPVRHVGP